MVETLGPLMSSSNSFRIKQDNSSRATVLGVPIFTLGDDKIKIKTNVYEITPEIHKALSSTSYSRRTMKDDICFNIWY